jgi:hypothetical protein
MGIDQIRSFEVWFLVPPEDTSAIWHIFKFQRPILHNDLSYKKNMVFWYATV